MKIKKKQERNGKIVEMFIKITSEVNKIIKE